MQIELLVHDRSLLPRKLGTANPTIIWDHEFREVAFFAYLELHHFYC